MSRTPIRRVSIEIENAPPSPDAVLIAPRPFDHWGQRLESVSFAGVETIEERRAANGRCVGLTARPIPGAALSLAYEVRLDPEATAPDWVWEIDANRYTTASAGLVDMAKELAEGAASETEVLRRLIANAAEVFTYGHVDEPFNAGEAAVPALCGVARGSCVDINTYLLAAARALGIRGQYIAGYWFHPEKTKTLDMHCWLAFAPDGRVEFWDVAHGLKWAETLGARVEEGLNPAGGRRVAMSCGRGLAFETPHGTVSISHFSEPVWISAGGVQTRPDFTATVVDPEGDRRQYPMMEDAA